MINGLKAKYGYKCSGIKVNGPGLKTNHPLKELRFCEAVSYSFDVPIRLTQENIGCKGAKRSLGIDKNDNELRKMISKNNKIPGRFVKEALNDIPTLSQKIFQISLGIVEEMEDMMMPDLFIMYVPPHKITELMLTLAGAEIKPVVPQYSFLSICGNVFVNSYINKIVTISFGCPESRLHGGVRCDEVILGIPLKFAKHII